MAGKGKDARSCCFTAYAEVYFAHTADRPISVSIEKSLHFA